MNQGQLNAKLPTFFEIMKEANESVDPSKVLKDAMTKDSRVVNILGYAFNPTAKIPLPEGIPPYVPGTSPLQLAEIELLHLASKIYILFNKESPKARREIAFIQWLEKMAPEEADLFILIKDQDLLSRYPNISMNHILNSLGWKEDVYLKLKEKAKQQ